MFTRESTEFFNRQQKFVFVRPDADMNTLTDLPFNEDDYTVVDADDLTTIGVPMDEYDEFSFWAVLEPGEYIENGVVNRR